MTSTDAGMLLAHERWFVDPSIGGDWGFFLSPLPLALVAAVPFNATLALFGQTELVGHLPVYGCSWRCWRTARTPGPLRWWPGCRSCTDCRG